MEFLKRLQSWGIREETAAGLKKHLGQPIAVERGATLIEAGAASEFVYFVEEGWLVTQNGLSEGSTVITDAILPGEIAGLGELAWDQAFSDTMAVTPVRAIALSRARLSDILDTVPGVAGVILTLMTVRSTARSDRHAMTLRASARERLLYLFVELHARQTVRRPIDWISMPLTQSQLADLVGLTNVHVSNMMKQLEADGVLERRPSKLRLIDVPQLRMDIGFRDRWGFPDFSWTSAFGGTVGLQERVKIQA